MEYAKFTLKFCNKMLPYSFNDYFTIFNDIHNYNTWQKTKKKIIIQTGMPEVGDN